MLNHSNRQTRPQLLPWLVLALMLALPTSVFPQPPDSQSGAALPEISTTIEPENPNLGEPLTLTLTFPFRISQLDFPAFNVPGLEIRFAGQSSRFEMTNRGTRQTYQLVYNITPEAAGDYEIPAQRLELSGRTFQTQAVRFTVSAASQDFWATLELDNDDLYVGELVPARLHVYFDPRVRVVQYPRQIESNFEGVTVGDWKPAGNKTVQSTDGRQFMRYTFAVALAPVKAGTITMAPVKTQWGIQKPQRQTRSMLDDSFFNSPFGGGIPGQAYAVTITSEPIELEAEALPQEGRPASFSGAVGKFGLLAEVQPSQVKVGEPLMLSLRVSGYGNFGRVNEPALTFREDDWQSYDPETEFRATDELGLEGHKIFKKMMVPTRKEAILPDVEFSYFDPDEEQYHTITPVTDLQVEIIGGSPPTQYLQDDEEPEDEPEPEAQPEPESEPVVADIRDIKTQSLQFGHFRSLLNNPVFWAVQGVPVAVLLALLFVSIAKARANRDAGARELARRRQEQRAILQRMGSTEDLSDRDLYTSAGEYLRLDCAQHVEIDPATVDDAQILDRCPDDPALASDLENLLTRKNNYLYGAPAQGQASAPMQERKRVVGILEQFSQAKTAQPGGDQ